MLFFPLIKTVLDTFYDEIPIKYEDSKDEAIKNSLKYLSRQYKNLAKGHVEIDYSDPVTRFAYVFRYVTCHAEIVHDTLFRTDCIDDLLEEDSITATCLGGGPGSDFLGILSYLYIYKFRNQFRCFMFDRESSWNETWVDIDSKLLPDANVKTSFENIDITDSSTWKTKKKYLKSDIFTSIYFLSELNDKKDEYINFLDHLFSHAKSNSIFLFVDNNNETFYSELEDLAKEHKLKCLYNRNENHKLTPSEEKRDLGEYFKKFGSPKIEANVAIRVYKMPQQNL